MYKTGWRMWVPPGVMMLSTLLAYIDRQTLAVLSPTILSDTGLSAGAYGEALTYFSIAYMIANPLWGSLLDYVGLRAGMLAAVAIWTSIPSRIAASMVLAGFFLIPILRPILPGPLGPIVGNIVLGGGWTGLGFRLWRQRGPTHRLD